MTEVEAPHTAPCGGRHLILQTGLGHAGRPLQKSWKRPLKTLSTYGYPRMQINIFFLLASGVGGAQRRPGQAAGGGGGVGERGGKLRALLRRGIWPGLHARANDRRARVHGRLCDHRGRVVWQREETGEGRRGALRLWPYGWSDTARPLRHCWARNP